MISRFTRCAPVCAVTVMLAGCGALPLSLSKGQDDMQPAMDASEALPHVRGLTAPQPEGIRHSGHSKSWMSPAAKTIKKLLYVSNGDNDVYVFNYKTKALVGTIAGYGQFSQGQCVDKLGNVWFTEFAITSGPGSAVEYAHGGSTPLKSLGTDGSSIGCSIDPTSGDLAVANSSNAAYGPPNIVVFKNASGTPKTYYNYYCGIPTRPGYDRQGNLYVEGHLGYGHPTIVCEIPHRGHALRPVSIDASIPIPEGVMWDGKHITLAGIAGSPPRTVIYQMAEDVSGNLKTVGKTVLEDSCNGIRAEVEEPFIVGNENTPANRRQSNAVVGGNMACVSTFDYWSYPAGGNAVETFPSYASSNQSVSIAPN